MLLKGEGVERNLNRSLEYMNAAADQGSAEALNGLGFMYHNGEVVPENLTLALEYFKVRLHSRVSESQIQATGVTGAVLSSCVCASFLLVPPEAR